EQLDALRTGRARDLLEQVGLLPDLEIPQIHGSARVGRKPVRELRHHILLGAFGRRRGPATGGEKHEETEFTAENAESAEGRKTFSVSAFSAFSAVKSGSLRHGRRPGRAPVRSRDAGFRWFPRRSPPPARRGNNARPETRACSRSRRESEWRGCKSG